jgi:hypothetical protein
MFSSKLLKKYIAGNFSFMAPELGKGGTASP